MDEMEHKERHKELHKALDELVADYISHKSKSLSETSVMELMQWSHEQTCHVTHRRAKDVANERRHTT